MAALVVVDMFKVDEVRCFGGALVGGGGCSWSESGLPVAESYPHNLG